MTGPEQPPIDIAYDEYLYDADPDTDGRAHGNGKGGELEPEGGWPAGDTDG